MAKFIGSFHIFYINLIFVSISSHSIVLNHSSITNYPSVTNGSCKYHKKVKQMNNHIYCTKEK